MDVSQCNGIGWPAIFTLALFAITCGWALAVSAGQLVRHHDAYTDEHRTPQDRG